MSNDLRSRFAKFDREIDWIVDSMYSDACEDIFREWEKAEPRPSVAEVTSLLYAHSDGLADAWDEYMADWEGDEDPDPDDAPGFAGSVEWLVRQYEGDNVKLFEEIDAERRRHRQADTSDVMVEAILYRYAGEGFAVGWTEWLRDNR